MYELAGLRDEMGDLAIEVASAFGVSLDHSVGSVKRVEKVLGEMHREFKRTGDDDGLNGVAFEFAAYIIQVIERNYEAGVWIRDHSQFGDDSFPYHWNGREIFPFAWCQKRIFDGPADNVWSKFKALVVREVG